MVRLSSKPIFDCPMDVRTKKVLGVTVPLTWSFAMSKLPEGRAVRVPPELGELIAATARRPTDSDPEELERALGQTLASVSAEPTDKNLRRTAIPPPHRVANEKYGRFDPANCISGDDRREAGALDRDEQEAVSAFG